MTNYLKKHLLFIVLFCIILFALLFILFNKSNNDIISNSDNMINNTNNGMFAIMLETEAGSGEYQESKSNTWPGEGYIFNENLSVCENGSELTWNEELGAVNLKTNIADKCYVYFDVYILPEILEVTASDITSNSITLTVNAVAGTNAIQTYYYSMDNGSSWVNSTSNSYTFSNLDSDTEYIFSVYVEDVSSKTSIIIYEMAITESGKPVILSVEFSTPFEGTFNIDNIILENPNDVYEYYIKINNDNFTKFELSDYFCNLAVNSTITFNYQVYVINSKGIPSDIYNNTATMYFDSGKTAGSCLFI